MGRVFPMTLTQSVDVYLYDADGEVLDRALDPPRVWEKSLRDEQSEDLVLLARVAPYDNTHITYAQLDELDREIAVLQAKATEESGAFFARVRDIIARARSSPKLKVVFVGD